MEILSNVTLFLILLFAVAFLIGIIRPDFIVFWSDNKSRSKVATVFGGITLLLFIVWGITSAQRGDTIKDKANPSDSTYQDQSR
ncbi:MAG: hypothetical protein V4714_21100 [Bacteroidota bacterium]